MPFVTIKWVEGHDQSRRETIARKVTDAIHETTGIPKAAVWVVFEDVKAEDWFTASTSVAAQRAAAKK